MIVGALSDTGACRECNEDSMHASICKDLPLFVVADGMGGHNAGDVASKMAVDLIKDQFLSNKKKLKSPKKIQEFIESTLIEVNEIIYKKSLSEISYEGMGTTVVLGYYYDNKFYLAHVGDSRAYSIVNDKLYQITEDHTLVNELLKKGTITKSQAINHPQRNLITQALGSSMDTKIDMNIIDFYPGDLLILCSDGLYNMVDEGTILEILKKTTYLKEGVKALVNKANENGGKDNITIIAIKLDNEVLE